MWREIITKCKQKREEAVVRRKREREESLVYTNGSDALKEATEYLVMLFDTFQYKDARNICTDGFNWSDIPHWKKVQYTNRDAEIASLQSSIQQILPQATFDDHDDGDDQMICIPTEEAVDEDIKDYQEEIERLNKLKQ